MSSIPFGHQFKDKYFGYLDPEVTLTNHGSFGTTPGIVVDAAKRALERHEKYPCRDALYTVTDEYKRQLKLVAGYLGLEYLNCAFVTNATTGVNTVLRSIPFDFQKDKVLFHSTTYGACANTVKFLHDYFGLQYDVVEINYPCEDDSVLEAFEAKLKTKEYKLCLFDLISSHPGVTIPYKGIIELCHKYDTWSLIDGAHSAGQVHLKFINELKPDFFTTNLHKWLYCPKSVALLYVDPKHHAMIQTMPISHNYSSPDCQYIEGDDEHNANLLINKFAFVGTASYASYMACEVALTFRKEICGGEDKIRQYQFQLQEEAIPKVLEVFGEGSKLLENSTKTLRPPGLFCVELPIPEDLKFLVTKMTADPVFFAKFKASCEKTAVFDHKCHAPFTLNNNHIFVRFSVQVFNEVQDYEKAAAVVKGIIYENLRKEASSS